MATNNYYPFVPYNPIYPQLYKTEKNRIISVLGDITVKHFGSTSVEGLSGKGYVDIYLAVPKDQLESISKILVEKLSYEYKPNAGKAGERLFHLRKVPNQSNSLDVYHLHLTYLGYKGFIKDIKFRDYLRTHPDAVKDYSEIKKIASVEASKARDKKEAKDTYMKIKEPVINSILAKIKQA